jgi:putative transposase
MRDVAILLIHLLVVIFRVARPGGIRSVIAESVLVKHQLMILNRSRKRAPNLRVLDRIITGLCSLLMRPARVNRSAMVLRPSTVFHLHRVLVKRKYRLLFSPKRRGKPGPRGPQKELVDAIVEMKRRNPTWGCPRIAQQITLAFGIEINKDDARRILSAHYRPDSHSGGLLADSQGCTRRLPWPMIVFAPEVTSETTGIVEGAANQTLRRTHSALICFNTPNLPNEVFSRHKWRCAVCLSERFEMPGFRNI